MSQIKVGQIWKWDDNKVEVISLTEEFVNYKYTSNFAEEFTYIEPRQHFEDNMKSYWTLIKQPLQRNLPEWF